MSQHDHRITVEKGDTFQLKFIFDEHISAKFPGNYIFESYDPKYILIQDFIWVYLFSTEEPYPALVVTCKAIDTGDTTVRGKVQLDSFNPLFLSVKYDISIIDSNLPDTNTKQGNEKSYWDLLMNLFHN